MAQTVVLLFVVLEFHTLGDPSLVAIPVGSTVQNTTKLNTSYQN